MFKNQVYDYSFSVNDPMRLAREMYLAVKDDFIQEEELNQTEKDILYKQLEDEMTAKLAVHINKMNPEKYMEN